MLLAFPHSGLSLPLELMRHKNRSLSPSINHEFFEISFQDSSRHLQKLSCLPRSCWDLDIKSSLTSPSASWFFRHRMTNGRMETHHRTFVLNHRSQRMFLLCQRHGRTFLMSQRHHRTFLIRLSPRHQRGRCASSTD
jgi:hypothetical protein